MNLRKSMTGSMTVFLFCGLLYGCTGTPSHKESTETTNGTAPASEAVAASSETSRKEAKDKEIKERIEQIYAEVFGAEGRRRVEYEKTFLTDDFYSVLSSALAKGANNREVALDHDLWHQAQDWNECSIEVKKVESSMTDAYYAYIDIIDKYPNGDNRTSVTLKLEYENDEWRIDDMLATSAGWEKDLLKKYLAGNTEEYTASESAEQTQKPTISANSIWERGYLQDEFGEQMRNCPYIYGEIDRGDEYFFFKISECEGIIVGYHRQFDPYELSEATKLSVKAQNGEIYRFSFTKKSGSLYITDKGEIQTFINLLVQGHFTMSVGFSSGNAYILKVSNETCDVQKVWQSFN